MEKTKSTIIFIISTFILFGIIGCKNRAIERKMINIYKKEFKLPDSMQVITTDHRIYDEIMPKSTSRLIIYYDSTECSSCRVIHLPDLDTLYNIKDSCYFSPIVIFRPIPKEYDRIKKLLIMQELKHPVYIDTSFQIQSLNSFIDIELPKVFLIDKYNKMQLVGNPLSSTKMWNLFNCVLDSIITIP